MAKPTTEGEARIGRGTTVRAKIVGSENLSIAGRLEGSLELAGTLVVESTGVVKAAVKVERATIAGIVVGDIDARDSVQIVPEGRILGDIRAARVAIAEGARFSGAIEMIRVEASESVTIRPEARAPVSPPTDRRPFQGIEESRDAPLRAAVLSPVISVTPVEPARAALPPEPVTEIAHAEVEPPRIEALADDVIPGAALGADILLPARESAQGMGFMPSGPGRAKLGQARRRIVVKKRIS